MFHLLCRRQRFVHGSDLARMDWLAWLVVDRLCLYASGVDANGPVLSIVCRRCGSYGWAGVARRWKGCLNASGIMVRSLSHRPLPLVVVGTSV